MRAAQHGRDLGLQWISLGSDPSLYGDLAMPGLFTFKARLGFVPIPIRCFDPTTVMRPTSPRRQRRAVERSCCRDMLLRWRNIAEGMFGVERIEGDVLVAVNLAVTSR